MFSVLESLLNTLLVIGTSVWGWLGLIAGFGGAFVVWHLLGTSPARAPAAAVAFVGIFMVIYWRELGKKWLRCFARGRDGNSHLAHCYCCCQAGPLGLRWTNRPQSPKSKPAKRSATLFRGPSRASGAYRTLQKVGATTKQGQGVFAGSAVRPNPSLKLTRYGRLCKPGLRYSVHLLSPGLQSLPPRAA